MVHSDFMVVIDENEFDSSAISTADMFQHHQLEMKRSISVLDDMRNRDDLTEAQDDLLDGLYVDAIEYEIQQGTLPLEEVAEYKFLLLDKPHVLEWLLSLPPTPELTAALREWYTESQDYMVDDPRALNVIWASEYYRRHLIVHYLVDDSLAPVGFFFIGYAGNRGFNFNPLFRELCVNFVTQETPRQREVIQYYKAHGAQVTEALLQAVRAVPGRMPAGQGRVMAAQRVPLVLEMLRL
jgi:hypothetical protein